MPTIPDILTVAEVARYMRISRDTVYRLAAEGDLRGRKIGRIWRFPKSAIEAYVHGDAPLPPRTLQTQAGQSAIDCKDAVPWASGDPPDAVA